MNDFLLALITTTVSLSCLALLLGGLASMGPAGKSVAVACQRAPGLDGVISLLTWIPWVLGLLLGGGWALLGVVLGQFAAVQIWCAFHEATHREAVAGPRILKVINSLVGPWRNHTALWLTTVVLPMFLLIRLSEIVLYPLLVALVGFPRYRHQEWINVTRHQFHGLVGHDLLWCHYCDWMTGVYSLGAEMLRNVESFWCPTRFHDERKCENCRADFPDIDNGWIAADGTMADVEKLLLEKYGNGPHCWFGHPERQQRQAQAPAKVEAS